MLKKILVYSAGFIGFLFFESFVRLIIMFYHRLGFQFFGVSGLPSPVWAIVILLSVLASTWLVSMLVLTILRTKPTQSALVFGTVLIGWRMAEAIKFSGSEPLWYYLSVTGLHITGVGLAWLLYTRQFTD